MKFEESGSGILPLECRLEACTTMLLVALPVVVRASSLHRELETQAVAGSRLHLRTSTFAFVTNALAALLSAHDPKVSDMVESGVWPLQNRPGSPRDPSRSASVRPIFIAMFAR